jgi:hypothetical protein
VMQNLQFDIIEIAELNIGTFNVSTFEFEVLLRFV